ncbi:uncharacterized protein LOC119272829 [Triticum dicoccoides]|uniref:uncharacterized protein LOC119272829 n=1 Tax=Triticum dicoccoides TaxID=85692 RepID=UPI00188EC186|nr:uncharacterized protein LOC119272829 [Triticum dicoccoides]
MLPSSFTHITRPRIHPSSCVTSSHPVILIGCFSLCHAPIGSSLKRTPSSSLRFPPPPQIDSTCVDSRRRRGILRQDRATTAAATGINHYTTLYARNDGMHVRKLVMNDASTDAAVISSPLQAWKENRKNDILAASGSIEFAAHSLFPRECSVW